MLLAGEFKMRSKELYTDKHSLDLSQKYGEYPEPSFEMKEWMKLLDSDNEAQKKFEELLEDKDECV